MNNIKEQMKNLQNTEHKLYQTIKCIHVQTSLIWSHFCAATGLDSLSVYQNTVHNYNETIKCTREHVDWNFGSTFKS